MRMRVTRRLDLLRGSLHVRITDSVFSSTVTLDGDSETSLIFTYQSYRFFAWDSIGHSLVNSRGGLVRQILAKSVEAAWHAGAFTMISLGTITTA